jgi:hypothetical protein
MIQCLDYVIQCSLGGGYKRHFHPEDGGSMYLQDIGSHLQDYMVSQPRRLQYECYGMP